MQVSESNHVRTFSLPRTQGFTRGYPSSTAFFPISPALGSALYNTASLT